MKTAVEWLSNQAYELFEQYSEGNFDRIQLNKLMVDATNKAKQMEKEQIIDGIVQKMMNELNIYSEVGILNLVKEAEQYYNQTFKSE